MKKIVVITITCNRLELTKKWLSQLENNESYPFEHIIVDNGSSDGTIEWLHDNDYLILSLKKNVGILKAWKIGIDYAIKNLKADFIVKFDNDCEIRTPNIITAAMNFYSKGCDNYVLAPLDENLNEEQYKRFKPKVLHVGVERDLKVNYVTHTGGMFQILPKKVAQMLLNENDELFINGDMKRGNYLRKKGIDTLYLTDYKVYHKGIDNQTEKYVL